MINRTLLALVLAAASTTTAFADAHSDIVNAMVNFKQLKSYHMEMTVGGRQSSADFLSPNRIHTFAAGNEVIQIDTTTYMRLNGTWKKYPGGPSVADTMAFASSHNGGFTATDLGMRTVGGTSLHAYSVKTLKTGNITTVFLDGSGRIVRMDTGKVVMILSKFNAPLTINAPM
ncbi:MAG TPA: hypothetical protein VGG89_12520 [Candidatus Baltobacteraceae bacterium]|jgi:hypothetical protein